MEIGNYGILQEISEPPSDQSYFLFGPRGTGKSLFLRNKYPDIQGVDLLLPTIFARYATRPEFLMEEWEAAQIDYRRDRGKNNELYYWRTTSGTEVDFVIYGDDGLMGIEVKNSKTIRPKDLNGLKAFKSDYEIADCFLLYGGDKVFLRDGIQCIPVGLFIAGVRPDFGPREFVG